MLDIFRLGYMFWGLVGLPTLASNILELWRQSVYTVMGRDPAIPNFDLKIEGSPIDFETGHFETNF
jgi:hypothetical protein